MKNFKLLFLAAAILASCMLTAQVAITTDGSDPDPSALLDVKSTDKGFLPPRMTQAQIEAITTPANGLTVFNITDNKLYIFVEAVNQWKEISYGAGTITPPFVCGQSIVDVRDSKSYATVLIGTQCWMAENLNIGTRIDGSGDQTNNSTIEKYCYGDAEANCDVYGGLYQWNEMMQYSTESVHGICPDGWHVPTDNEWMILEEEVESSTGVNWNTTGPRGTDAGGNLKETGTNHWSSTSIGVTNSSGFTALPGGFRYIDGSFNTLGDYGFWWSSSEFDASRAWRRSLFYDNTNVYRYLDDKSIGFSVRCLKDN